LEIDQYGKPQALSSGLKPKQWQITARVCAGAGFFAIAYMSGGPVSVVWGWIVVAIMNIIVALSMAEIVSAYPIAGGPYFW
jgi:amino acid transporter